MLRVPRSVLRVENPKRTVASCVLIRLLIKWVFKLSLRSVVIPAGDVPDGADFVNSLPGL